MKKKNVFTSLRSAIILGIIALTTSCTQGDFSDFYDDEDLSMEGMVPLKKGTKDSPGNPIVFPKSNDLINNNSTVKSLADQCWNNMKNSTGCTEYGFLIYYNVVTGEITCGGIQSGQPGVNAMITLQGNDNYPILRCAAFHTHTNPQNMPTGLSRPTGPSNADEELIVGNVHLPVILYDFWGGVVRGGESLSRLSRELYLAGPIQRTNIR